MESACITVRRINIRELRLFTNNTIAICVALTDDISCEECAVSLASGQKTVEIPI